MLAGLLVVLLIEAAHQLFEDRAHRVVVDPGVRRWAQVDRGVRELLNQRPECVRTREPRDLVSELEAVEDLLDVRREPIEIGLEVSTQLLLARPRPQVAHRELGGVVERLSSGLPERDILIDDARFVERPLHVQHVSARRL